VARYGRLPLEPVSSLLPLCTSTLLLYQQLPSEAVRTKPPILSPGVPASRAAVAEVAAAVDPAAAICASLKGVPCAAGPAQSKAAGGEGGGFLDKADQYVKVMYGASARGRAPTLTQVSTSRVPALCAGWELIPGVRLLG